MNSKLFAVVAAGVASGGLLSSARLVEAAEVASSPSPEPQLIGRLNTGAVVSGILSGDGRWGIEVAGAGQSSLSQAQPFQIELWDGRRVTPLAMAYQSGKCKRNLDWPHDLGALTGPVCL